MLTVSSACPWLFVGPLLCARFWAGDTGHQDSLVLALEGEEIQKSRSPREHCYPGRECGHQTGGSGDTSPRKWLLSWDQTDAQGLAK